jgi:microsomal dipeptidase-like Zn-dependent dipeptidase
MKTRTAALLFGLLIAPTTLAFAQELPSFIGRPGGVVPGLDIQLPVQLSIKSLRWPPAKGKFYVKTALANRYLDVYTGNASAGTPLQISDKVSSTNPNQVWEIIPSPEPGFVYIKSEMGRYLDVQWGNAAAGTPVHLWDFNGGIAQKWRIEAIDDQYFTIRSQLGTYLDVQYGQVANGTPVWMWPGNSGAAQRWTFETAGSGNLLSGLVDMHTHPMSYLGFGRKAMHGAPSIGSIVPAGTRDCNRTDFRATSIEQALGHCNSTHGGWDAFNNGCGDYLRAGIINAALDKHFIHKTDFRLNLHGDHEHTGYPDFRYWPHQSSILHQQMWTDWIRRAHDGGLRVMVALTVNSELLAEVLNGDPPYDDKSVADAQIDETIRFVNNSDFMRIAYSAADVREIVRSNKLAVVLGMEVDKLGNFGKPGVPTNDAAVRSEIQRLYGKGIRYVFPVHLIDNSFGGAAVYEMLFNFANRQANGYYFRVMTSSDPAVAYHASLTLGPLGLDNGLILGLQGLLKGLGQIPAPCFNNIRCFPPPGKVLCCGSYEKVLKSLSPSPDLEAYKLISPGHVNQLGLTPLGEVAINEMMKLGLIIDVDHMSERSMTRTIEIAEAVPEGYPVVMGHNGLRGAPGSERSAPIALVRRIAALNGMFGVGTSNTTPDELIANYRAVWEEMGWRAVAIGTDVNGFERLPRHTKAPDQATSNRFYSRFLRESGIASKQRTGTRTWDYVTDNGVSHYGLLPEFLFDVKTSANGAEVFDHLMRSAEDFAQTWEKAERSKLNVH